MAMHKDVDTSMLRRAIWNYIHCMFGIRLVCFLCLKWIFPLGSIIQVLGTHTGAYVYILMTISSPNSVLLCFIEPLHCSLGFFSSVQAKEKGGEGIELGTLTRVK
jgi:hypothetical protein